MTKDWAEHKEIIIDLYHCQNKTLKDVRIIMADTYDFRASTRAYRGQLEKWNIRKYTLRKNQAGQGGSTSTSEGSSPNGLVLRANGNIQPQGDERQDLSMLDDAQIPCISLTNPFHQGHPHQQQQQQQQIQSQQRNRPPHLSIPSGSRRHRQEQQQGYQRRGSHGVNHVSQPRHAPNDLPFAYPDATQNMARTRSNRTRPPTHSQRMSTGYLQFPSINQDPNSTHHLQYPRSFQLPHPNTQLPSPAPSPSFNSSFPGSNLSPLSMLPSRSRPRTNSTPESLSQHMALPRGYSYYHSSQEARPMPHQRSLCDGPDTNYILSSTSDRFSFPTYGLGGDEWVASDEDGVISSYPPPPTASRRDHR